MVEISKVLKNIKIYLCRPPFFSKLAVGGPENLLTIYSFTRSFKQLQTLLVTLSIIQTPC